jgi:hypothetical protein
MATPTKIFRVRKLSGQAGGSHFYHHADIIAPTWQKAIKAAKAGRVRNWRWVDSYDSNETDYENFQFLYRVRDEGKNPQRPVPKN